MTFWAKSLRIFNCLCESGTQSVRQIAHKTGFTKSSVHRLQQAIARRNHHPESWLWETEDGRHWVTRLVVATLYTFGLKRGVGLETLSEFFARLRLETQVGCSPSALRSVMQMLETSIMATALAWEQDGIAHGEMREIIGAVDETFLEQMMLVFQDLSSGYLLLETTAEDRSYATWKALVQERLQTLKTGVLYLVSDRAKALIQLAEQGLECLSLPDFFHVVHDIVKSYSLALGRRVRQAHKDLKQAEAMLECHRGHAHVESADPEAKAQVEARQAEVRRWEAVQSAYRHHLETLSLTLHPFSIVGSAPQTSAQVERRLYAEVEALEALVRCHQLPVRHNAMTKVRVQLPALAALVDLWWHGVEQDVEPFGLSPRWRQWVYACLLPLVYWDHQVSRTRCRRRKAKIQEAWEAVRAAFEQHAITQQLAPQVLAAWHAWATDRVQVFQRASSAVEGRNGYLSQMQHNQRGLPKRRYKVWTMLHNFDCRAADGTTPAARFFRRSFPDLFETVLSTIATVPRPRQRYQAMALTG
jgi:uncharacterized protein DUF6399/IclR-like helix-turn-helix domain-containing protein